MTGTPAITTVAHTGITVSDLNRAAAFFSDALGASITDPTLLEGPGISRVTGVEAARILIRFVDLPGHRIELLQYLEPVPHETSTLRPCDNGHLHLSLFVEDIPMAIARMERHGFAAVGPLVQDDGTPLKAIYAKGFDGLIIELMDARQFGRS